VKITLDNRSPIYLTHAIMAVKARIGVIIISSIIIIPPGEKREE
jgi:hypothetical protein